MMQHGPVAHTDGAWRCSCSSQAPTVPTAPALPNRAAPAHGPALQMELSRSRSSISDRSCAVSGAGRDTTAACTVVSALSCSGAPAMMVAAVGRQRAGRFEQVVSLSSRHMRPVV